MPIMETDNSNDSRAEELKLLANEAFKGDITCFYHPLFFFLSLFRSLEFLNEFVEH